MPGATGTFRAGKNGRIVFNGTNLFLRNGNVRESGQDLPTLNFEGWTSAYGSTGNGGGRLFDQGLIGAETAEFNCDGNWNAAQNPFGTLPGIYTRDDGPRQDIYLNRNDVTFYLFYTTRILGAEVGVPVDNLVSFRYNGKNQGPYQRPIGSV